MFVENVIIGAGPAGLAMSARFVKSNLPFVLLEQADTIVPKWFAHYDRLHLHTVKEFSSLPFLDFPDDYPQYVSKFQLTDYYQNYIQILGIEPVYKTKVSSIKKVAEHWIVETNNGIYECKNVIIASGLNRIPRIPKWKGIEHFEGEIMHASSYKNAKPFIGKKVLVVGMGNTGAELALDLAEHKIDSSIAVRSEVVIVPRDLFGRSVQLTARKLDKLPFGLGDWIGTFSGKIAFGDLKKYGLPISNVAPTVLRREHGKTPTIDIGTVAKIKTGEIKIKKGIKELNKRTVVFDDGTEDNYDLLLLATGYTASIDEFLHTQSNCFIENAEPAFKIGKEEFKGLHFIGFEKHTYGGTLGTLKEESEAILNSILIP